MASLDRDRLDRDRLMRLYAPRLAAEAAGLTDTRADLVDIQVVDAPTSEDDEPAEPDQTGVMVALYLPPDIAAGLALNQDAAPEGVDIEEPDELHLTLAYLGTAGIDVTVDQLDRLAQAVAAWATDAAPLQGVISGIGVFNNEDSIVTYASFDSPALPTARQHLVATLTAAGFTVSDDHGFTPHITLAYGDLRGLNIPRIPVTFDDVTLAYAGQQMTLPLGTGENDDDTATPGQADPPAANETAGTDDAAQPHVAALHTNPRQQSFMTSPSAPGAAGTSTGTSITWTPIVTTSGARTVITAPATTERAAMWGSVPNPNKHILWMQGRYVGAETPNRNGAFWATSDLQLGQPTVAHGPLNWLHEEKHIIGAIADAKFVPTPQPADGTQKAAETTDPHITALSAIWTWLYPQEASVVQMASDAGVLAYSMECIARSIQCVGDNGCGQTFDYMQVAAAGGGCVHLQQHTSIHRLVQPTFLGGAVIVPPTRPGWADADASIIKEAASLAEKTYAQAGSPNIPATTWEQLMAGVVSYTKGKP